MTAPDCNCGPGRETVCHQFGTEPHFVGCPRWGTVIAVPPPSFEQLLRDPHEQFDPRSKLRAAILASIQEYADAPPATFTLTAQQAVTAVPPRPAAPELLYPRIGRAELDRLRATLTRPDRDELSPWEVVEIAADEAEARKAAPDATAGDGLRDLQHRIELAIMGRTAPRAAEQVMAVLRDVLAAAARDAELREAVISLAVRFETFGEVLHDVRAAETYADAAASLREVLDGET